jgi:hypothetical protein
MHTHTRNQHCLDRSSSHKPTTLLITTKHVRDQLSLSLSLSLSLARSLARSTDQIQKHSKQGYYPLRDTSTDRLLGPMCSRNSTRSGDASKTNPEASLSLSLFLFLSLSRFSAKRFAWSVSLKAAEAATSTTWTVFSSRRNLKCHKIDCSGRKGSGGYLDRLTACQRNACAKIQ